MSAPRKTIETTATQHRSKRPSPAQLFARITALLEDAHIPAMAGQAAGLSPNRIQRLAAQIRQAVARVESLCRLAESGEPHARKRQNLSKR